MERFEKVETLFAEGWELNQNNDAVGSCDKWLEAWDIIKELFAEGAAEDIDDLDKKNKWTHYPSNLCTIPGNGTS